MKKEKKKTGRIIAIYRHRIKTRFKKRASIWIGIFGVMLLPFPLPIPFLRLWIVLAFILIEGKKGLAVLRFPKIGKKEQH